jgi:hypothetical protein
VRVTLASGVRELDLHSNDVFGGGFGACTSRTLTFEVVAGGAPPSGPRGMVRNNILEGGGCTTVLIVEESSAAADPRLFQNNDLFAALAATPVPLYRDEGTTNLTTIAAVNALTDITSSGNLAANPLLTATNHLMATSPCRNTGIATNAPATDIDNQARPNESVFDIGSDEYYP